jgi:predicted negative regulator of RcsB-dependent stress response
MRAGSNQKGSAVAKFVIVLFVLILVSYAGYNYISALYESQALESEIQTAVLQGSAQAGQKAIDIPKARIERVVKEYNLPQDTYIEVKVVNNLVQARVYYKKKVSLLPFGMWDYEYVFDKTITPTGYLTKQ